MLSLTWASQLLILRFRTGRDTRARRQRSAAEGRPDERPPPRTALALEAERAGDEHDAARVSLQLVDDDVGGGAAAEARTQGEHQQRRRPSQAAHHRATSGRWGCRAVGRRCSSGSLVGRWGVARDFNSVNSVRNPAGKRGNPSSSRLPSAALVSSGDQSRPCSWASLAAAGRPLPPHAGRAPAARCRPELGRPRRCPCAVAPLAGHGGSGASDPCLRPPPLGQPGATRAPRPRRCAC